MGFSAPRRARLPETNHIMWIVFVIHFQSSPLLGRVPEDLLPLHYYVSCIHVLEMRTEETPKVFVAVTPDLLALSCTLPVSPSPS